MGQGSPISVKRRRVCAPSAGCSLAPSIGTREEEKVYPLHHSPAQGLRKTEAGYRGTMVKSQVLYGPLTAALFREAEPDEKYQRRLHEKEQQFIEYKMPGFNPSNIQSFGFK